MSRSTKESEEAYKAFMTIRSNLHTALKNWKDDEPRKIFESTSTLERAIQALEIQCLEVAPQVINGTAQGVPETSDVCVLCILFPPAHDLSAI
jgi:hypothetical protein